MHETTPLLLVTLPNIHRFNFFHSHTKLYRPKPFLIWLLTTPPRLKYVPTLPCNLSLMACFADINVSQSTGSVETYARCDGTFNIHLTANFPENLPMIFFKSVTS